MPFLAANTTALSNIVRRTLGCSIVCLLSPLIMTAAQAEQISELGPDVSLYEGDIIKPHFKLQARGFGANSARNRWEDGIVPYRIDPTLSQYSVDTIKSAIAHWNRVSGISFKSVDEVAKTQRSIEDSVLFKNTTGCASWIGKQGGEQQVWVGPNCTTGSVMHEIGHVLGLEHEHTRPDRDQHIVIHWDNISADKAHNFDIATSGSSVLGEYDYGSIMHYGRYNFSFAGKPTITPLVGSANSIGQRAAPSQGDLEAVAELYSADLSVIAQLHPSGNGSEAAIHVSNNDVQGAHDVEVRVSIDSSLVLGYSDNGWLCETNNSDALICTLDRLANGSSRVLRLELAPGNAVSSYQAVVRAKTPDANSINNSNVYSAGSPDVVSNTKPSVAAAVPQNDELSLASTGAITIHWGWLFFVVFGRQTLARQYQQFPPSG